MGILRDQGLRSRYVGPRRAARAEPVLAARRTVAGGIYSPIARPATATSSPTASPTWCAAEKGTSASLWRHAVRGWSSRATGCARRCTDHGEVAADAFVLAVGRRQRVPGAADRRPAADLSGEGLLDHRAAIRTGAWPRRWACVDEDRLVAMSPPRRPAARGRPRRCSPATTAATGREDFRSILAISRAALRRRGRLRRRGALDAACGR